MVYKGQTALVHSDKRAKWVSSAAIARNLKAAYQIYLGDGFLSYHLSQQINQSHLDLIQLARKVLLQNPSQLVFTDDIVSPEKFLYALSYVYGAIPLPSLYFHLYGNFTLRTRAWLRTEPVLKKTQVRWICSSDRQSRLVGRFLNRKDDSISVCPFPVNPKEYSYHPGLREEARRQLSFHENETVILYTGRLSLQKNILRMTEEIFKILSSSGLNLKLLLVGRFEDLGTPFFKTSGRQAMGAHFHQWNALLEKLPSELHSRVLLLGAQPAYELKGIYNACDIFVSLSLYHDEDYGMSPAEALCCGLPVILTDWGGFAGFDFHCNSCHLLPVRLESSGLRICSDSMRDAIADFSGTLHDSTLRKRRSRVAQQNISVPAIAQRLGQIHSERTSRFSGFSPIMREHAASSSKSVLFPEGVRKGGFYEKIYGAYLR